MLDIILLKWKAKSIIELYQNCASLHDNIIFNISEIMFSVSAADAPPQPQVDGTAPTFSKKPTIRQEDSGNTLVFHCAIVADPLPQITWYHNGVKVQDTAKYQVTNFT